MNDHLLTLIAPSLFLHFQMTIDRKNEKTQKIQHISTQHNTTQLTFFPPFEDHDTIPFHD
jgi:hypothetical protein